MVISACDTNKAEVCTECDGMFSEVVTMFVDSEQKPCSNETSELCFYYQIGDTINESAWQPFDGDICGFTFTPGYQYKLSVKRKKIGKDEQGDKIYQYCLVSIIEKNSVGL